MEVKETAACGISEREFAVALKENEIVKFYKWLDAALENGEDTEDGMIDDMLGSMEHVVGAALNE